MRISDWSSDVCSSDLLVSRPIDEVLREAERLVKGGVRELLVVSQGTSAYGVDVKYAPGEWRGAQYQTRDRKSVVAGKRVSVRVGLGGRRSHKTKQKLTYRDIRYNRKAQIRRTY